LRTLRKTKECLNCKQILSEDFDYCPVCGQQNDNKNVSFGELIQDLIENIFSFDTRLAHSIVPFFVKPGFLTNRFNEGKRRMYANPIRLYLIISIFFFFVLSIVVSDFTREVEKQFDDDAVESLGEEIKTQLDSAELRDIKSDVKFRITDDTTSADLWPLSNDQWKLFIDLKDNEKLSEQQFFDSLHVENRAAFTQYTVRQIIRVYKRDKEYLTLFIVQNLSIMMFVMIPIFAMILKVLYLRRKQLYINHLIHTLHIHTFALLVYGMIMISEHFWIESESIDDWFTFISFVVVTTYAYVSFLNVYGQKWFKTLIKFWIVGFFYFNALWMAFVVELFFSFLIF